MATATREARYSDLRAIAEVAAAAFQDDELFGEFMNPHRKEYPNDYMRGWEQDLRVQWLDHEYTILVSVDQTSGRVVAAAKWQRQGEGGMSRQLSIFDPQRVLRPLVSFYNIVESWLWPNRAADPSKATVLEDSGALCSFNWSGSRKENWYLDLLAVHPDFQGKGLGRELAQWGIREAKREGVCASLIAVAGTEDFYRKLGFVEVGRANVGPLRGLKGGAIMFNDAKA